MGKMGFRSFIWPENPETYSLKCKREALYGKDSQGNDVYIGLSEPVRTVSGSGVFTGPMAFENFQALEEEMLDSTSGLLVQPQGGSLVAYFTELTMEQDARPMFLRYHFTFREADSSGGLTE